MRQKVKRTVKQILEIKELMQSIRDNSNDKLNAAMSRVNLSIDQAMDINSGVKEYNIRFADLRDELSGVDAQGNILSEGLHDKRSFTPDNQKAFRKRHQELLLVYHATEIEFENWICPEDAPGYERCKYVDIVTKERLHGILFNCPPEEAPVGIDELVTARDEAQPEKEKSIKAA